MYRHPAGPEIDEGFGGVCRACAELAPDPPELYRQLRRVSVRYIGTVDDGVLAGPICVGATKSFAFQQPSPRTCSVRSDR